MKPEPAQVALRTLPELERVIERGMQTFVEVGEALLEIRDGRLYREAGFKDFDSYCRERWGWSRRHVNRTIEATKVAAILGPMGPMPTNERQARALAPLADKPEVVQRVWTGVRERHGPKVTAAVVRDAVDAELRAQDMRSEAVEKAAQINALAPEGFDPVVDRARIQITQAFYEAVHTLATMPAAEQVARMVPDYQAKRMDELPGALDWLAEFAQAWKEIHG